MSKRKAKLVTPTAPSTILDTAKGLIYGDRNKVYRHPTENFSNIAGLFNAYFIAISRRPDTRQQVDAVPQLTGQFDYTLKINEIDVAYLNILQKIARGATTQDHLDTIVDIAGYAGCIERILKKQ